MMAFIQRLVKSLRSARTVELPDDEKTAFYMLMPMILNNQHRSLNELLTNSNFNVNYCHGKAQRSLLHISANCGSYDSLCLLIKKGSGVNMQDVSGCTPLHLAARNGFRKCVIKLLESQADINICGKDGLTMIHWLAVNGRTELLQELFSYIKNVNVVDLQGQTALHVACQNGHKAAVQCLLDNGALIDWMNNYGWTPLHFACSHGQHETAKLLLSKGASLTIRLKDQTAGTLSEAQSDPPSPQLGTNLRECMQTKTPLVLAVEGGYSELCSILVDHSPSLLSSLVDLVSDVHINEASILKVMKHLCYHGNQMFSQLLQLLSQQALNIGHKLLSTSSIMETHTPTLLRCVRLLSKLYTLPSSVVQDQSVTMVMKLEYLQPMEPLWKLMEDWLAIVQVELENCCDIVESDKCTTGRAVKSAPADMLTDVFVQDNKADDTKLSCVDVGEVARPQSLSEKQMDVLTNIVPRLCAVIQAFYMVCTCHTPDQSPSSRFLEFVSKYKSVLTSIIERNPTVIFDHFHFLLDCPDIMADFIHIIKTQPFEARTKWFYDNLYPDVEHLTPEPGVPNETEILIIDRGKLFQSSCSEVLRIQPEKLKRELALRFIGEEGVGQGVIREWFDVLSKEILNPDYALFTMSADGSTFQPNSNSAVNPDHLNYFRFAGLCLGMALYHKQLLNVYFTRSFYKHILGVPANYTDVASIDPEYAKNLQWILDHDITPLGLDLAFSVETDVFGIMEERELKPGGSNIAVTEDNKAEYVQLVTDLKMTQAIQPQIDSFLSGFHVFVPHKLIQMFDEYELELMLSGIPEIDLEDWKKNTTYIDCDMDTDVIKWFWESLEEFSQQDRVLLLQFVTGSSRLPYGGFCQLAGASGSQRFTISCIPYKNNLLPTASTCVNFLKLPLYQSKEETLDRLSVALHCGGPGFSLA